MQHAGKTAPSAVFSILHDGVIVAHEWTDDALVLTVNILYLAELLDPSFRALTVRLDGVRDVRFRPWPKAVGAAPEELHVRDDLRAVLAAEPDILHAKWDAGTARTTVDLNQGSPALDYYGGELSFACDAVIVSDPRGITRELTELSDVARRYWATFSDRAPPSPS